MSQRTSNILMIRPSAFRMNEETAVNNYYQRVLEKLSTENVEDCALEEFDNMVDILKSEGINVIVFDDSPDTDTPDSLFPNNWVSFHSDGRVGLYPMFARNRRIERREDILLDLEHNIGFTINEIVDFTEFEEHSVFLEGTGSIVIDRIHKKAYASISPRTDRIAFEQFCDSFNLDGVVFESFQTINDSREAIYHTNVMMCIGSGWAAVCLDSIDNQDDKEIITDSLLKDNIEIIALSEYQISLFAGNMLEVASKNDDIPRIIMSLSAHKSLTDSQIESLSKYGKIISFPLDVIEACGGGSARCMMAEVHLPYLIK
ncbi:MAG: amidinotransferase [Bacteroidetes bacterium]|nr:MAG: amidinotransferase [Bacteroidota bacterium]